MRILLTGASGFIGRHLLHALLADGHDVVCAVRRPQLADRVDGQSARHETTGRLTSIHADFSQDTDKSAWLARLSGIDAVINTVGIFRESGAQTFARLHTETPRALFAACAESEDVHMVVQLSALGADAEADTPYHLSKKAADDYLASLPIRACIVQPSLVYGPGGASTRTFKAMASAPLTLRLGDAPQLVQPIHIDDLVTAIVRMLRQRLHIDGRAAPAHGSTAQRIALVGPQALSFIDYLSALRAAMGMGRMHVLRLSNGAARMLARVGPYLPGGLLDPEALRMLDRGNTADPAATTRLLGRPPRTIASFVTEPDAERTRAKLDWLLPPLRWTIVVVWLWTAIVSSLVYPAALSYDLLARTGVPPGLRPAMLYGASAFDLAMGLGILFLPRRGRRWLWLAQLALIGFYTVVIALRLPEFLVHPYGPLVKNLPMLAAIWLLYEFDGKDK